MDRLRANASALASDATRMTYGGTLAASIVQGREGIYSHVSRKIYVSREQTKKWFYQIVYGMECDPWVEHLIERALNDDSDGGGGGD